MNPDDLRAIAEKAITTSLTKENWAAFKQAFTPSTCLALLDELDGLKAQLSTIRKEATDAERERAAGIADDLKALLERRPDLSDTHTIGGAKVACEEIAQAIRAPTGDEGK